LILINYFRSSSRGSTPFILLSPTFSAFEYLFDQCIDALYAELRRLNASSGDASGVSFEVDAKPALMAGLTGLIAEQPHVLLEAAASSAVATVDPIPTPPPATAAGGADEIESETDEGV
jgi:hypothetical protein